MTNTLKATPRRLPVAYAPLLPLVLCLLLFGCGGGGGNGGGSGNSPSAPAAPSAPATPTASAALPNGLTATLAEDRASLPVGAPVTYTVTVTNPTAQPVTFQAYLGNTSTRFSLSAFFIIRDPAGTVAYQGPVSASGVAVAFGPAITLGPGQSTTTTLAAPAGVFAQPGAYSATAYLTLYTGPATDAGSELKAAQSTTVGPLALTVQ